MTDQPPPSNSDAVPHPGPGDTRERSSPIRDIDRLLRGQYTDEQQLRSGRLAIPIRTLALGSLLLGAFYGASMGLFSGLNASAGNGYWRPLLVAVLLAPALHGAVIGAW
ncbi:MAG: hypothetical protein AAGG01_12140 [Planctomycetota bacterium]